jgi:hypothetical protein
LMDLLAVSFGPALRFVSIHMVVCRAYMYLWQYIALPRYIGKMEQPRVFRLAFPILWQLALKPHQTPHALEVKCKIERHTVLDAMELLLRAGHVKFVKAGRFAATGRDIKEYDVTPHGIVALLQAHPDYQTLSSDDLKEIAEKQSAFLPLVFGKWDHFITRHQEKSARAFLLKAAKHTPSEVERLTQGLSAEPPQSIEEHVHRHNIYSYLFVDFNDDIDGNESREWLETIKADREILDMAKKEAKLLRIEAKVGLDALDDYLKALRSKGDVPSPVGGFVFTRSFAEALYSDYRSFATWELDRGDPPPTFEKYTKSFRLKQIKRKASQGSWRQL